MGKVIEGGKFDKEEGYVIDDVDDRCIEFSLVYNWVW